jgi:hypothetical protein
MLRQTVGHRASPLPFLFFPLLLCDVSEARSFFTITIANVATLLVFALQRMKLQSNMLVCKPVTESATGEDIFNLTNKYFQANETDCGAKSIYTESAFDGLRNEFPALTDQLLRFYCRFQLPFLRESISFVHVPET